MIAILGLVSTGLSIASSVLGIAKLIKTWHKPAGYLIRFINWIGAIVDALTAFIEKCQSWLGSEKEVVERKKQVHKARKLKGKRAWPKWKWSRRWKK